jgi:hypothetical protein
VERKGVASLELLAETAKKFCRLLNPYPTATSFLNGLEDVHNWSRSTRITHFSAVSEMRHWWVW